MHCSGDSGPLSGRQEAPETDNTGLWSEEMPQDRACVKLATMHVCQYRGDRAERNRNFSCVPPPHHTWICCTMVRSCTRNSLASLALSDNPFSAWESWLCGEKEGKLELPSRRDTWGLLQSKRLLTPGAIS